MASFLTSVARSEEEVSAATAIDEIDVHSGDVKNFDNSPLRWKNAISFFHESCRTLREGTTGQKCCVNAVLDVSGSMEGEKLIAVKLGLCSLVANLADDDELNITAFSGRCKPVTNGFQSIGLLKVEVPKLLHKLQTDGCTACFDAIISGIKDLRSHTRANIGTSSPPQKNILIALTDGEDNESKHRASHVLQHILNPGITKFTFLMVAADMQRREERAFRDWMDLVHCKQISVSVNTGTRLVSVFKEMLLSRILQTDVENTRFLQECGEGIDVDLSKLIDTTETDSTFQRLRQQYARRATVKASGVAVEGCEEEEADDDSDCDSCGISRCYSCSDHDDNDGGDSLSSESDFDTCDDDTSDIDEDMRSVSSDESAISMESYTGHLPDSTLDLIITLEQNS